MPSSKDRILNSRPRRARSSTTTRNVCSRTATAGSVRSPRTLHSTRRTGEGDDGAFTIHSTSCPALCRASTPCFLEQKEDVDGRDKPGHDEENSGDGRMIAALFFYLFAGICVGS